MTDEQIDAALKVCEARRDGNNNPGPIPINSSWMKAVIDAYVGYEAALRALKAARERIAELEAAAQSAVALGTVEN